MTLFGTTIEPQQLMALIMLLTLIAFWSVVLMRERAWEKWYREWEAQRKARRQAQVGRTPDDPNRPRGPWG
ncbi:MAG: hypothetical protein ACK4E3_06315 [Brevundimonas sp.]|jgi:hypothetical protein|uniref:hypothetical protein n=1 Tax=Brevundimonas sp. TaxID=1871086 RepID=UPI00391AC738